MLATLRQMFEYYVTVDKFPAKVFDVGAGSRSIRNGLTHVFSNQPTMSAADCLRN